MIYNNYSARPMLNMGDAIKLAWSKLTQFTGRSRRSEYWWCFLAAYIANIVCNFIPIIGSIASLLIGLAMIPLTFRRLHDTGRSGWWYGANLIGAIIGSIVISGSIFMSFHENRLTVGSSPMEVFRIIMSSTWALIAIGAGVLYSIMILVFTCQDSQPEENRYGESPKYYIEEEDSDVPPIPEAEMEKE